MPIPVGCLSEDSSTAVKPAHTAEAFVKMPVSCLVSGLAKPLRAVVAGTDKAVFSGPGMNTPVRNHVAGTNESPGTALLRAHKGSFSGMGAQVPCQFQLVDELFSTVFIGTDMALLSCVATLVHCQTLWLDKPFRTTLVGTDTALFSRVAIHMRCQTLQVEIGFVAPLVETGKRLFSRVKTPVHYQTA